MSEEVNNEKIIVVYHAPCFDGYGARYLIQQFLSRSWMVAQHEKHYRPIVFGPNTEDEFKSDFYSRGDLVIFADYCPSTQTLIELRDRGCTMLILDHHQTALKHVEHFEDFKTLNSPKSSKFCALYSKWLTDKLANVGSVSKVFNMKKSGAGLAYQFFWADPNLNFDIKGRKDGKKSSLVGMAKLADYLEDRDLWKFSLSNSKEVNAYLQSFSYTMEDYEELERLFRSKIGFNAMVAGGLAILKSVDHLIGTVTNNKVKVVEIFDSQKTQRVGFYNSASHWSEVGNAVLQSNPNIDIACGLTFDFVKHSIMFSLRSRAGSDVDCSVLASKLAGGGHRNAAGANTLIGNGMELFNKWGVI